jgi:hypothetical protein
MLRLISLRLEAWGYTNKEHLRGLVIGRSLPNIKALITNIQAIATNVSVYLSVYRYWGSGDGGGNIISKPRTKVRAESLNLLKQVVIFMQSTSVDFSY